jgi:hypothetical protein
MFGVQSLRLTSRITLFFFLWMTLQPLRALAEQPATPPPPAPTLEDTLDDLRATAERAESKAKRGKDNQPEKDRLLKHLLKLDGLESDAEADFAEVEAHLKAHQLPAEIQARHRAAVAEFRTKMVELKQYLRELDQAHDKKDRTNEQRALGDLTAFLKKEQKRRPQQPFDPKNLPFRTSDEKARPAKEKKEELEPLLHSAKPVQVATTDLTPGLLAQTALGLTPTPDDLTETEDVQLTQAIKDQAAALHHNPVDIWNWVRNTIEFIPTYGSIQGSDLTLQTQRGNAFDTASLLIALLRASGIPARYVYGTIQVPAEQAMNWVGGVTTPEAAQNLLGQGGIPTTALVSGGKITAFKLEHVWVSAYVDYIPSRGAVNRQGDTWVPLDGSFKQYTYSQSMNIKTAVPLDTKGFIDQIKRGATVNDAEGWAQNVDPNLVQTLIADYQNRIYAHVVGQKPDATINDVVGGKTIVTHAYPILMGSLPYQTVAEGEPLAKLPNTLRWKLQLHYFTSDIDLATDTMALSKEISLPGLADKRLGISYLPASEADAQVIADAQQSGATALPAYLINIKPDIQIDGQSLVQGPALRMGQPVYWRLTFQGPGRQPFPADYKATTGDEIVFGVNATGLDRRDPQALFSRFLVPSAANNLQLVALTYWFQHDLYDRLLAQASGITTLRLPSAGLFASRFNARYFFGIPRSGSYLGRSMDVRQSMRGYTGGTQAVRAAVVRESGIHGSYLEGFVFDQIFDQEPGTGVSATRLMQRAQAEGAKVYRVDQSNVATVLPLLAVGETVKTDIRNAVAAGQYGVVPDREFAAGNWQGAGYYIIDPTTGAGAYLLDGGYNGGNDGGPCSMTPSTQPATSPVSSLAFGIFFVVGVVALSAYAAELALGSLVFGMMVSSGAQAASPTGSSGLPKPHLLRLWDEVFSSLYGQWPNGQYPGDGIKWPGDCTEEQIRVLDAEKDTLCNKTPIVCDGKKMDCPILEQTTKNRIACITKRLEIMSVCYKGGDKLHWDELERHLQGLHNCRTCLARAQANQCRTQ